jgi:methionyl-tRNA formyltransferase
MKVIIFTNSNSNQIALVNKIFQQVTIEAIVVSKNIIKNKKVKKTPLFYKLVQFVIELPFKYAWQKLQLEYKKNFPTFPNTKIFEVDNINDKKTIKIISDIDPSLIIVSGTNLIKDNIINSVNKKCLIMNLHTGISPYIKGGPNCTNWCLSKNRFDLIGNTIMELDVGIDSGKIIATEQTQLIGNETLFEIHWKVMEHAHDLYIRAIKCYLINKKIFKINQNEIDRGETFYTKDWTIKPIITGLFNYYFFFRSKRMKKTSINMYKIFPLNCKNKGNKNDD